MRKTLMFVLVLLIIGTFSFAADFQPIQLELDSPDFVQFQGGAISFDVNVIGTPATVIFMVFTNNKGDTIEAVRNGYLGWHYVNGIDTCIFVSPNNEFGTGINAINWTGNDADGNAVPADEVDGYKYYLYGFDHETAKQLAAPVTTGWENAAMWREYDADGLPMDNPDHYPSISAGADTLLWITRSKWVMGTDVTDTDALETCRYLGFWEHSPHMPSPVNMENFFSYSVDGAFIARVKKFQWTPDGDAILDTEWGDSGEVNFSFITTADGWQKYSGSIVVSDDIIAASATDISGVETQASLKLISIEGGYIESTLDLTDWWIRMDDGDPDNGGQQSSGPNDFDFANGMLVMGSHSTCMNQMIDPNADVDDELSWNKWVNQNGDPNYTGDHNFEETAKHPWICHDYAVGPYKYNTDTDALNFVCFPAYDCGAVTHGLYAPDGTGLGYYAAAGEYAAGKWMAKYLDNGSAYDGLYTDGMNLGVGTAGMFYIAQDSFMGYLQYDPISVEEDAPAQFAVAQNSPNPFNPTTTISFEIADPGTVTIDVYNVAGQKVDTLVNEHMEDGTHSRVWDATGFSAGVYFYTVKSGNMSKTMSMTLLK